MGWSALAIAIIAVLSLLARTLRKRRRRARTIAAAEAETRVHLKAIAAAIVSRNFDELGTVPVRISEICRIAEAHGVELQDIHTSKLRLDYWRTRAKEMLSGDDMPTERLPASRTNSPLNILNPDEPGTPGIPINATPDIPEGGWTTRPAEQALAAQDLPDTGADAIARMIEGSLQSDPEGGLLPERQVIQVVTIDEEGNTLTTFELDTDGPFIELTFDDMTNEALSDEELFERLFDRMIEK